LKTRIKHLRLPVGFLLGSIIVFVAASVSWLAYSVLSPDASRNQAAALDCTLEWGRLAPFPPSAQKLTIAADGTMFTREFRSSFVALPEDIEEWLKSSPGTREAVETTPQLGVRHFQIKPGGGAGFAEVTVDETQHRVTIRVYWS
jgi:hypothetical protein